MNVKSADKYLQFGYDKCRAMVVGKKSESYHIPKLQVDTWNTHHTKEGDIVEYFAGKKDMQVCQELTYLGVEISSDGRNMKTILRKRNKNIGKKKQITNLIKPLGIFTFECAIIFLNSLVRSSVLYATEAMYNINEKEMRQLEKIEEDHMRNILDVKTGIQVPLHLMYLDLGQVPARYQVKRFQVNFLQYILQQDESSLLHRMLRAQQQQPVRGDWFSEVSGIIKDLDIGLDIEQIRTTKRVVFRRISKQKCEEAAFKALLKKGTMGKKAKIFNMEDN